MFLVIFVLLAIATVPLAGGRLSRLADLGSGPYRWSLSPWPSRS